jgi:heme/copper-type cytochrome/quinol oxidase subunit 3
MVTKPVVRRRVRRRRPRYSNVALGLAGFLIVETLFFISLFFGYIYLREETATWLPSGFVAPDRTLATANVALLLVSSVTIGYAAWAIRRDNRSGMWAGLVATFILGFIFVMGQIYEFNHLGFAVGEGGYTSSFYMLRTSHGLHVFSGMLFQLVILIRAHLGQFSAQRNTAVQGCAVFWYFVALLWLPIYGMLYF